MHQPRVHLPPALTALTARRGLQWAEEGKGRIDREAACSGRSLVVSTPALVLAMVRCIAVPGSGLLQLISNSSTFTLRYAAPWQLPWRRTWWWHQLDAWATCPSVRCAARLAHTPRSPPSSSPYERPQLNAIGAAGDMMQVGQRVGGRAVMAAAGATRLPVRRTASRSCLTRCVHTYRGGGETLTHTHAVMARARSPDLSSRLTDAPVCCWGAGQVEGRDVEVDGHHERAGHDGRSRGAGIALTLVHPSLSGGYGSSHSLLSSLSKTQQRGVAARPLLRPCRGHHAG